MSGPDLRRPPRRTNRRRQLGPVLGGCRHRAPTPRGEGLSRSRPGQMDPALRRLGRPPGQRVVDQLLIDRGFGQPVRRHDHSDHGVQSAPGHPPVSQGLRAQVRGKTTDHRGQVLATRPPGARLTPPAWTEGPFIGSGMIDPRPVPRALIRRLASGRPRERDVGSRA